MSKKKTISKIPTHSAMIAEAKSLQDNRFNENGFWKNMSKNMDLTNKNKEFIRHSLNSINNLKKKNDIVENWNRLQAPNANAT